MSSPNLNMFILVGCLLTYISVILYGLDAANMAPDMLIPICHVSNISLITDDYFQHIK